MDPVLPVALFDPFNISVTKSTCTAENSCPDSDPPKPLSFRCDIAGLLLTH